jgi:nitroreductase
MNFFELINARRSVRLFQPKPVEEEKIQKILAAANQAPSAGNLQAYTILVVRKPQLRQALAHPALDQQSLVQAPVVLVFIALQRLSAAKYRDRGGELFAVQDATIACAYAQLAAAELGLGSVWIGAFNDDAVKHVLKVEAEWRPVAMLPIGYSAETPKPTPRRSLAELAKETDHL